MALIANTQPEKIEAGNTLAFLFVAPDFDPATYTCTYRIVGVDDNYTVTGTDNGDGSHLFTADAATTATWSAGTYQYYITATSGADRYTAATGAVTVLPDPGVGGFDARSHVKTVLDAIEAVIRGKATSDQLSYTIGSRSISKMAPEEIEKWRAQYKAEYARELQAERMAKGLGSPRSIKVRIR